MRLVKKKRNVFIDGVQFSEDGSVIYHESATADLMQLLSENGLEIGDAHSVATSCSEISEGEAAAIIRQIIAALDDKNVKRRERRLAEALERSKAAAQRASESEVQTHVEGTGKELEKAVTQLMSEGMSRADAYCAAIEREPRLYEAILEDTVDIGVRNV